MYKNRLSVFISHLLFSAYTDHRNFPERVKYAIFIWPTLKWLNYAIYMVLP